MKKSVYEYIYLYDGNNLNQDIINLAEKISKNKDLKVHFDVDYSGCYYEGDNPSYQLVIDGFENDD